MNTKIIISIIMVAVCVVLIIIAYVSGKKNEKKIDQQQAAIDEMGQSYTMLIIDKKKIRMKEAGLPPQVVEETPWYARLAKVPIVKAKVGPRIMTLIADNAIYDSIPVKKEVKATVAGIYISEVRGIRGPLPKPKKKKGFMARLMGEK